MTDRAIIDGSLVDVRNVNQHKCVRLIIDVPAERARQVIDAFGWPTMVNPVSVAIARLTEKASQQPRPVSPPEPAGADNYAKRLGIVCGEPAFWQFVMSRLPRSASINVSGEKEAADAVRYLCGVHSRRETIKGTDAGIKARNLLLDYDNWNRGVA
jgi:hypothetical protein